MSKARLAISGDPIRDGLSWYWPGASRQVPHCRHGRRALRLPAESEEALLGRTRPAHANILGSLSHALREGCHNTGSVALPGRGFEPTRAKLARARRGKADRFRFEEVPDEALYNDQFHGPMPWNSNFFITPQSIKILRVLADVWLRDFKLGPA